MSWCYVQEMDNWEKVGEIRLEGKDVYLLKEQYILEPNKEERYYRLYFYIVCQELMDKSTWLCAITISCKSFWKVYSGWCFFFPKSSCLKLLKSCLIWQRLYICFWFISTLYIYRGLQEELNLVLLYLS